VGEHSKSHFKAGARLPTSPEMLQWRADIPVDIPVRCEVGCYRAEEILKADDNSTLLRTRMSTRMSARRSVDWRSALLHVETENQVLIPQIQFPIANDRMRPNAALRTANVALRFQLETSVFLPAFG